MELGLRGFNLGSCAQASLSKCERTKEVTQEDRQAVESPPQLSTASKAMLIGILREGEWFQVQINGGTFTKVQLVSSFQDFSESLK